MTPIRDVGSKSFLDISILQPPVGTVSSLFRRILPANGTPRHSSIRRLTVRRRPVHSRAVSRRLQGTA